MTMAVRALGYWPADDNEADALALLRYVMEQGVMKTEHPALEVMV